MARAAIRNERAGIKRLRTADSSVINAHSAYKAPKTLKGSEVPPTTTAGPAAPLGRRETRLWPADPGAYGGRKARRAGRYDIHRTLRRLTADAAIAGVIRERQNRIGGNDDNPIGAGYVPPPAS